MGLRRLTYLLRRDEVTKQKFANCDMMYQRKLLSIFIVVAGLLLLLSLRANAADIISCDGFDVRIIDVSHVNADVFLQEKTTDIDVIPIRVLTNSQGRYGAIWGKAFEIIVVGPILGSMDSNEFAPVLKCRGDKIELIVNLIRSAEFDGSVLDNTLWRPVIELQVFARRADAHFEAQWVMHLTDGTAVSRDLNESGQSFPIIYSRAITFH
jgi:hypothetical protein